jgi:deoxyribodipyrimidine photo-lyase
MNKQSQKALFIFHRDLRIADNSGLNWARKNFDLVVPIFIFNPLQCEPKQNDYFSENAFQFLLTSLSELDAELVKLNSGLNCFYGDNLEVVKSLIESLSPSVIVTSRDYTSFARKRDQELEQLAHDKGVEFKIFADSLLFEPEEIKNNQGEPYKVFTPFRRKAETLNQKEVSFVNKNNFAANNFALNNNLTHQLTAGLSYLQKSVNTLVKGGRKEAMTILGNLQRFKNYAQQRDYPALDKTTHLSAHLKFGTVSVREVFKAIKEQLGKNHDLLTELYWRDFFCHLVFHYPRVLGSSFRSKYDQIAWQQDNTKLKAWQQGQTGFPLVDAAMRQLNQTGYMHNRLRMLTASFLVKDLHLDWRVGERYFAQKLVDYDPAVNNGNWQWNASTGADAAPYFRIFSPLSQLKRFDTEGKFVRQFVPELRDLGGKEIINLTPKVAESCGYTKPIVDHQKEVQKTKELFRGLT